MDASKALVKLWILYNDGHKQAFYSFSYDERRGLQNCVDKMYRRLIYPYRENIHKAVFYEVETQLPIYKYNC